MGVVGVDQDAYTAITQMDAAATIIFMFGKLQHLFEGSYHAFMSQCPFFSVDPTSTISCGLHY